VTPISPCRIQSPDDDGDKFARGSDVGRIRSDDALLLRARALGKTPLDQATPPRAEGAGRPNGGLLLGGDSSGHRRVEYSAEQADPKRLVAYPIHRLQADGENRVELGEARESILGDLFGEMSKVKIHVFAGYALSNLFARRVQK
jgi:hypothetical protein